MFINNWIIISYEIQKFPTPRWNFHFRVIFFGFVNFLLAIHAQMIEDRIMINEDKQKVQMASQLLEEFADIIVTSYEFACEWPATYKVAEIIEDETECLLTRNESFAVLNLAKAKWENIKVKSKND